ncbi:YfjI family protein [Kineococcus sp. TBRC 1896]|uniref:YfjI family protein n=1 Tax=Kineococcus mangrovi TaxID=1660183 RepID=A0ABV4HWJ4_9ACTN
MNTEAYDGPVPDPWGNPPVHDAGGPLIPLSQPRATREFPAHTLPDWAAPFVQSLTVATQVPSALVGGLVLGALAVVAGGRAELQIRPGWREPLNVFVAPVLPPATRKSPVFKAVLAPLYEVERELVAQALPVILEARTAKEVADGQAEAARRKASKAHPGDADALADALAAAETAAGLTVPPEPRYFADDATPEAVAALLARHGGRLSIASAEGGFFELIGGRYSNGVANLDTVLKAYSGDPIRVDRRGRDPEYVNDPALNLVLTVQPDVLRAVGSNPTMGGRGLLARFWFLLPPSTVGRRRIAADPVPAQVSTGYAAQLRHLALDLARWESDRCLLQLSADAEAVFRAEEARVEPQLAPGEALATSANLQAWGGKLMGSTARLVGLLHVAEHGSDQTLVQAETVQRAIVLARWLTEHALEAYRAMRANPADANAERVLVNLRRRQLRQFSVRDLKVSVADDLRDDEVLRPALAVLVEHGHIWRLEEDQQRTGRPRSPRYAVHPDALSDPAESPTEHTKPPAGAPSVCSVGDSQPYDNAAETWEPGEPPPLEEWRPVLDRDRRTPTQPTDQGDAA